jgi:hypothetical protein
MKTKSIRLTCDSCKKKILFKDAWRVVATRKDYCTHCWYILVGLNEPKRKQ